MNFLKQNYQFILIILLVCVCACYESERESMSETHRNFLQQQLKEQDAALIESKTKIMILTELNKNCQMEITNLKTIFKDINR